MPPTSVYSNILHIVHRDTLWAHTPHVLAAHRSISPRHVLGSKLGHHQYEGQSGLPWNSGLLELRTSWHQDYLTTELLEYWTTGLLDYRTSRLKTFRLQKTRFRTTELLHHPTSEILEKLNYWATKLQNCWNTIPLDYCVLRLGIGWQDFWTTGLLTY